MDVAMALISVAPAYIALIAEAWIDAVVARGMPADQASAMVGRGDRGLGRPADRQRRRHAAHAARGDDARRRDRAGPGRARARRDPRRVPRRGGRGRGPRALSLRIDHVLYAVSDLEAGATRFEEDLGLESIRGGRTPAGARPTGSCRWVRTTSSWSASSIAPSPRRRSSGASSSTPAIGSWAGPWRPTTSTRR